MKRKRVASSVIAAALGVVLAASPALTGAGVVLADEQMGQEFVAEVQNPIQEPVAPLAEATDSGAQGGSPDQNSNSNVGTLNTNSDPEQTYSVTTVASPTDGGSATANPTSDVKSAALVELSATSNLGYKFVKWTSDTAGVEFKDASSATTTFTMVAENATITANFEEVGTVTVTFDGNGGKSSESKETTTKEVTKGEKTEVTPDTFVREGYKLLGWSLTKKAKSEEIISGDKIELSAEDAKQDVTYYAQWEKKTTHTIKLTDDSNGTATADTSEAVEGETVTLTSTPNSGYEFDAWEVKSGDVTIEGNKFTMGNKDVEIHATFKKSSSEEVDFKAPEIKSDQTGTISRGEEVTFTITQKVPKNATYVMVWTDLDPVLTFASSEDDVVAKYDGNDIDRKYVHIDGQRLYVLVDDADYATKVQGSTISISYNAKVSPNADLSSYMASGGTMALVPYQAHSKFSADGEVKSSDAKKLKVAGDYGNSSSGTTSSGSTTAAKANTLAKTGDPVSVAAAVAALFSGAGLVLAGRNKRRK